MYEYVWSTKRKKPKEETIDKKKKEKTKENLGILSMKKKSMFREEFYILHLYKRCVISSRVFSFFFCLIQIETIVVIIIKKKIPAFNLYAI